MSKQDLFKLNELKVLPYEKPDKTWISVTFEMDLNRVEYTRSRYTLFDLLSDVGGLSGIFFSVFALIMSAWNYNSLDNYMVTHLFKIAPDKNQPQESEIKKSEAKKFPSHIMPQCTDYLMSWIPDRCKSCCRQNRKDKSFQMARDRLEKEMNFIELI